MINNNNIQFYMRKETSTLLAFTAAAILLLSSPMLFFNVLLQPVQATQLPPISFKTPTPAIIPNGNATLSFDAKGTSSSSHPQSMNITDGILQITNSSSGKVIYSGNIIDGTFTNNTGGGYITADGLLDQPDGTFHFSTPCSTLEHNDIAVDIHTSMDLVLDFNGPVECSSSQGGGNSTTTTAQPSSSMTNGTTTTTLDRDSDSDGIPDSSDKCTHNSNPRCFKEA